MNNNVLTLYVINNVKLFILIKKYFKHPKHSTYIIE